MHKYKKMLKLADYKKYLTKNVNRYSRFSIPLYSPLLPPTPLTPLYPPPPLLSSTYTL